MTSSTVTDKGEISLHQKVLGSRRLSNYSWATIVTLGASGFSLASISSYLKVNLLIVTDATELIFVPQGLVMGIYGIAGMLLALYLWLVILWDVGGGYNEFNQETGKFKIFRWGFPGKTAKLPLKALYEIYSLFAFLLKKVSILNEHFISRSRREGIFP